MRNFAANLQIDSKYTLCNITLNICAYPGGDQIFRPSRLALGPTQPPVKWVPGLSRGKGWPERAAEHSPPSSAAVREE